MKANDTSVRVRVDIPLSFVWKSVINFTWYLATVSQRSAKDGSTFQNDAQQERVCFATPIQTTASLDFAFTCTCWQK